MDPVNKWLTVIILFMAAVLFTMYHASGAGRYAFEVRDSQYFEKTAIVYVLDTKDGTVEALMMMEESLTASDRKPKSYPSDVFERRSNRYGRGY